MSKLVHVVWSNTTSKLKSQCWCGGSCARANRLLAPDCLSAIELAKNPIYHARTKHVDIIYHFVRENLLKNSINLVYENTSTILADNLTKPTSISKLQDFTSKINLVDISTKKY